MALVKNSAAVMIRDADAKEQLWRETFSLIKDEQKLQTLGKNILGMAKPDAAKEIVDVILNELKK